VGAIRLVKSARPLHPPLSVVTSTICMVYFRLTQSKRKPYHLARPEDWSRGRAGFQKQTFTGGFGASSHPMHEPLLVCGAEQYRTTPASNLAAATWAFAGCEMPPDAGGWTTFLRQAPLRTRCKCSGSGGLCVPACVPIIVPPSSDWDLTTPPSWPYPEWID
jgi:hypothetical protein